MNWRKIFRKIISIDQDQVIRRLQKLSAGTEHPMKQPGILLRVDDFPSPYANSEDFLKFHAIASENHVPYLLAVTPFLERKENDGKLTAREIEILKKCEDVEVALHGFTHRRRSLKPPSELLGMPISELRRELDRAMEFLKTLGFSPSVFVAPFNTYDKSTLGEIAARFLVFCGGPESVYSIGRQIPAFLKGSFYLPSYQGAYDLDPSQFNAFEQLRKRSENFVLPVTLHWANEVKNDFRCFREFCRRYSGVVIPWKKFIGKVQEIRAAA